MVTHDLFALKADVYDFALSFTWNVCINVSTYVCQTFSLEMKYTTIWLKECNQGPQNVGSLIHNLVGYLLCWRFWSVDLLPFRKEVCLCTSIVALLYLWWSSFRLFSVIPDLLASFKQVDFGLLMTYTCFFQAGFVYRSTNDLLALEQVVRLVILWPILASSFWGCLSRSFVFWSCNDILAQCEALWSLKRFCFSDFFSLG